MHQNAFVGRNPPGRTGELTVIPNPVTGLRERQGRQQNNKWAENTKVSDRVMCYGLEGIKAYTVFLPVQRAYKIQYSLLQLSVVKWPHILPVRDWQRTETAFDTAMHSSTNNSMTSL